MLEFAAFFYMCVYWGLGISSPKNAHPGFDRSLHVINILSQKKEWGQVGKLEKIFWLLRFLEEHITLRLNNAASFVLQEFFSFVILLFAANYILMSTN